jgi:uncharacterized protein with NAD-binding domain and iron-sulfur cluster
MSARRRRVIVIGGGCGGLAAAWRLSRTPALRSRFDVTVVQPGWRLGGKGATGRDPRHGDAIQEHGLHLWLGFYRHAFAMIRDVYEAWERPEIGPLRSLETAFTPLHDVVLVGGAGADADLWRVRFPSLPGRPWDADEASWAGHVSGWLAQLGALLVPAPGDPGWTLARARVGASLAATIARGLARDLGVSGGARTARWEAIDELDLRAWLVRHGASAEVADAPPIRALYDLGFAYPDGKPGPGRGAMAAGAGLRALLQIFGGYRGAPFWRMNAGMGDTIFAPLYEVLAARGVRFQFFHRLDRLRLGADRSSVEAIELGVQARERVGYRPLVSLPELGLRVWPHAPLREQLDTVAEGDLEADEGPVLDRRTLRAGADFDDVVLAVPSTVHGRFASELIEASPRYRAMVEATTAVPTIAAQWWLTRRPADLGWDGVPPVMTGLDGLFRTWADLGELVDAERWTSHGTSGPGVGTRPATVAYFCNVAPPELFGATDRAAAGRWVADEMRAWAGSEALSSAWPAASDGRGWFDEGALHAHDGEAPWEAQYARANVAGWERYVLTPPGSVRHRMRPGESGFTNLVLAGDWTRNAIDGGSVEGAVTSGVEAGEVLVARDTRAAAPALRA